ncbi:hypothetical protein MMC07_002839 [Pseudocyphellaria aurata]|nr:hypothetical protein [Pseudocyphellaria aurata]
MLPVMTCRILDKEDAHKVFVEFAKTLKLSMVLTEHELQGKFVPRLFSPSQANAANPVGVSAIRSGVSQDGATITTLKINDPKRVFDVFFKPSEKPTIPTHRTIPPVMMQPARHDIRGSGFPTPSYNGQTTGHAPFFYQYPLLQTNPTGRGHLPYAPWQDNTKGYISARNPETRQAPLPNRIQRGQGRAHAQTRRDESHFTMAGPIIARSS